MRCFGVTLVLVAVVASSARADGPIVVRAGLGITMDLDLDDEMLHYTSRIADPTGPGFCLDVGYRFIEQLAAGIHVGITRNSAIVWYHDELGASPMYHETYTPLQLGVSAQVSVSRLWAAPWIGVNDGVNGSADRYFAYGLGLGVDAYVARSGHRVGAFVDIIGGSNVPYEGDHHYLSAGLAYRYW